MKQTLTRLLLTLPVIGCSLARLSAHPSGSRRSHSADAGRSATPADIGALRHQYGLDLPLPHQYIRIGGVLHGDLNSIRLHESVTHLIASAIPIPSRSPSRP